jgi:hypothetical protein
MKNKLKFSGSIIIVFFFLFIAFGSFDETETEINGSIKENVYFGKTEIKADAGKNLVRGHNYKYLIKHVWKIAKENPNVKEVDINLIIKGDDGYGNKKTADWLHLIFKNYMLDDLRLYTDINKLESYEVENLLDNAGMIKIIDGCCDLSKDVFKVVSKNN